MTEVRCNNSRCRLNVDGHCTLGEVEIEVQEFDDTLLPVCMDEVVDFPQVNPLQSAASDKSPIVWYVDGSGTGNIACVNGAKTKVLEKFTKAKTNNEAEWEAVLCALNYVGPGCHVEIRTDSLDVVKWLDGSFKTRDVRMKDYKERVQFMIKQKRLGVNVVHVPREENLAGLFMEGKLRID